jgi:hypothetical protein
VLWCRNSAAATPTPATFEQWTQRFANIFHDEFVTGMSNQVHFLNMNGLYYGLDGIDLAIDVPDSRTGTAAGTRLPANVALCVSWLVQQHYRGGHPRTYFTGMMYSACDDMTTWTSATVADWHDRANNFHGAVNGGFSDMPGLFLGTVSFVLRNEWRTPPVFRDYVRDGARVDTRIDSQRRRLGRDR